MRQGDNPQTLYLLVKGNSKTSVLNVASASLANVNGSQIAQLGNQDTWVNASNWHVYYYGGTQPADNIQSGIQNAKIIAQNKPVSITETGYYTAINATEWGAGGVLESVQARLILHTLMDAINNGTRETYIYELMDNISNPSSVDLEDTFGLFHGDGTPKLAATSLHNLTTILSDKGSSARTFIQSPLDDLTIELPNTGHSYLMQKSNGHYFLIVWSEPAIWDTTKRTKIDVTPSQINISLAKPVNFSIYDPIFGTNAKANYLGKTSIVATLVDHPIIIEITR